MARRFFRLNRSLQRPHGGASPCRDEAGAISASGPSGVGRLALQQALQLAFGLGATASATSHWPLSLMNRRAITIATAGAITTAYISRQAPSSGMLARIR